MKCTPRWHCGLRVPAPAAPLLLTTAVLSALALCLLPATARAQPPILLYDNLSKLGPQATPGQYTPADALPPIVPTVGDARYPEHFYTPETIGGNTITEAYADDINFPKDPILKYSPHVTLNQFSLYLTNRNTEDVTIRLRLRFWDDDHSVPDPVHPPFNYDAPGTYLHTAGSANNVDISSFFDQTVTLAAAPASGSGTIGYSSTLVTFNLPFGGLNIPTTAPQGDPQRIWAGFVIDNNFNTTGADANDMLNIGPLLNNPNGRHTKALVGSSADVYAYTSAAHADGEARNDPFEPVLANRTDGSFDDNGILVNLDGNFAYQAWLGGVGILPEPDTFGMMVIVGVPALCLLARRRRNTPKN